MLGGRRLTIFVEGEMDAWVVRRLFIAADFYASARIELRPLGGKTVIAKELQRGPGFQQSKYAALIDADVASVADSRALAREQLGYPDIEVFSAVPTIEAWLFADPEMALSLARSANAKETIARLPLPEEIPHPKQLASYVFGRFKEPTRLMDCPLDLGLAMARSPSLRIFVEGVGKLLGAKVHAEFPVRRSSDTRSIVSTLLRELPADQIAWVTMSGEVIDASTLASAISDGLPIGNQYATELLRVARDLIARQATPPK